MTISLMGWPSKLLTIWCSNGVLSYDFVSNLLLWFDWALADISMGAVDVE
jgi:hypothetical protein